VVSEMSASIQGRLVNGTEVKLPENFQGLFMTKNKAGSNKIFVTSTFKTFKAWNYDKMPTKNDPVQKVWDWIGISEAVMKHITSLCSVLIIYLFALNYSCTQMTMTLLKVHQIHECPTYFLTVQCVLNKG